MRYGSVCSGIEAATVAWHPIGWQAAWLAEIEPFPSAVLAHHYPAVPNLGDMTQLPRRVLQGEVEAPDILVGGTPCQAFSVAGMREGLNDPRGQLTIKYVELADAIDTIRARDGQHPVVTVWENVPGVLSSKDNAFGCFLGALVGESDALQPAGGRWSDAGCVYGPRRAVAWRVLDAQYFGLAQRRRRVFVVASAREGFDPAAVLFELDGLRRDTPPSREAGQGVTGTLAGGARRRGGYSHDDIPLTAGTLRHSDGGADVDHGMAGHLVPVAATLDASYGRLQGCSNQDAGHGYSHLVVHGTQDPDVRFGQAHTLGRNNGQENAVLAFSCKDYGADAGVVAPTLRAMGHGASHANGGGQVAVCVTGEITHTLTAEGFDASEDGSGRGQPIVAAFAENSRAELRYEGGDGQVAGALSTGGGKVGQGTPSVQVGMAVRRFTPVECERLQGFPDNYTLIPSWDGWRPMGEDETPELCREQGLEVRQARSGKWSVKDADGPRYKALGNSKAIPVVRWLGQRLDRALRMLGLPAETTQRPARRSA